MTRSTDARPGLRDRPGIQKRIKTMQRTTARLSYNTFQVRPLITAAVVLLLVLFAGIFVYFYGLRSAAPVTNISQSALEAKYGLRVNLIGVTAAGGLVDLRLKIVDGAKAKLLLQNKKNFPALSAGGVILKASEETAAQEIKFDDGGNLFLMFPNSGNSVKPGSAVVVRFGDLALDAIISH